MVLWPCHFGLVVASYIILPVRKDVGEERPVGGIAAERQSEKGRLTDRHTDTYTEKGSNRVLVSLPRAHAH